MARSVLVQSGSLQYCGHLGPEGYTMFLISELDRYGRRDDPLSIVLAWPVHRSLPLSEIRRAQDELGLFGRITCLDAAGCPVDFGSGREEAPPGVMQDEIAPSLTAMRRTAIRLTQGRLLIGGRRTDYQGFMPGVLEEAALAVAADQPVFLAGGFGGVTTDIIEVIDPNAIAWFSSRFAGDTDKGWTSGIADLKTLVDNRGWTALRNGLEPQENIRLAATHRPSEVAALVSLGLGRIAGAGTLIRPDVRL